MAAAIPGVSSLSCGWGAPGPCLECLLLSGTWLLHWDGHPTMQSSTATVSPTRAPCERIPRVWAGKKMISCIPGNPFFSTAAFGMKCRRSPSSCKHPTQLGFSCRPL